MTSVDTEVLIVGAGPTGLVLALWLARLGVRFRIVDEALEPGTTSRALVLHARTLELYRQVGIAQSVVERSLPFAAANLWARGRKAGRVAIGDIGAGLTPFPYMLVFPQDEHERLLIATLAARGIRVERGIALEDYADEGERIVARLRSCDGRPGHDGGNATCAARYVVGCDGAHSRVRTAMQAGFPGGTYSRMFYVADVDAEGPVMNGELNIELDDADFLGVFPLAGEGRARFIGTVLAERATDHALEWSDVSRVVLERMNVRVHRVNWFSTYHVHHRVANAFRNRRAFIAGDAAHIHSPVGGQGMNTGIGDAVNLSWKLAAVLRGAADPRLLDTYDPERMAFANRLVETTDRAFTLVTSDGPLARFVRLEVVPRVLPALFEIEAVRRFMFRVVSQTAIQYRASALSRDRAGAVEGGDRLPWVPGAAGASDNHAALDKLDWQVHVYGRPGHDLERLCVERGIALFAFAWSDAAQRAGLARDAAYLVRPDGYVALAQADGRAGKVRAHLDAWSIRPLAAASPAPTSAPAPVAY